MPKARSLNFDANSLIVFAWPERASLSRLAEHALVVPADFASRDVADAMLDARGKEIVHEDARSVKAVFGIQPLDIAKAMLPHEVPDDVRYLIELVRDLCAV